MNGMNGLMKPAKKKDKKDCVFIDFYKISLLKIIIFFIIFCMALPQYQLFYCYLFIGYLVNPFNLLTIKYVLSCF